MVDQKQEKTGAEIIVDCLKAEGVKFVFGVIGSSILDLLDVLYRTPEYATFPRSMSRAQPSWPTDMRGSPERQVSAPPLADPAYRTW